jgi:methylated-DNA-[protein]-cysteine S-methyltransferase
VRAASWQQASPYGVVSVVVSERGVAEIALPDDELQPPRDFGRRDREIAGQLDDWFSGRRHTFDVPVDLGDIDGFRRTVLETLTKRVAWGETVSYGELAELAGRPRAARAVGSAMRNNPVPFVIPCHRVIAAGNKIGGYGGGRNAIELKRKLLAREGVML